MVKYIIKRILLSILILFGVSVLLYTLVRMMPVSFVENKFASISGAGAKPEVLEAMLDQYGLRDIDFNEDGVISFWDKTGSILKGYWSWLSGFIVGDWGESWKYEQPVQTVIFENMGISFAISLVSLILQLIIAIPLGIKCAVNQYGKLDYTVTFLTMVGISFPSFFFANLLIKLFVAELGWFPVSSNGFTGFADTVWKLVLPMVTLVLLSVGSLMRYTRTNTLEVLNADYIRTARAKGLSENKVIYKHVFRNTLIPLVTMLAGTLPGLFGGAMITEQVFSIPGIGQKAYQAMYEGDIPFIMGYNMFIAILTVIGILLTDIMYGVVDPRVKIGK